MRYRTLRLSSSPLVCCQAYCELAWMGKDTELKIDRQGNLRLVCGKNGFTYMMVDKEGTVHIANIPQFWSSRTIRGLVSACLHTYTGYRFYFSFSRGVPAIYRNRGDGEYDWQTAPPVVPNWVFEMYRLSVASRHIFMVEDERTKEITVSINGNITGARMKGKKGKAKTCW